MVLMNVSPEEARKPGFDLDKAISDQRQMELDKYESMMLPINRFEPKWNPVKERLPEEDGRYLVSFKCNPDVHVFFFAKDIKEYCDNNISGFSGIIIKDGHSVTEPISGFFDLDFFEDAPEEHSAFVDNGHVIAWMPLPESYKEDY